jgi:hypothetical protein
LLNEIGLRDNGRLGLLAAFENAEFMLPLRVVDDVEIRATIVSRGHRPRHHRVPRPPTAPPRAGSNAGRPSRHCMLSEQPEFAARAVTISLRQNACCEINS